MKSNKSVKESISQVTSDAKGLPCKFIGEYLLCNEPDGYEDWHFVVYYEPVSLDASGNIQAVSKG